MVTGTVAIYEPEPGGHARVARTVVSCRTYYWYHIAIVAPDGVARYTTAATTVDQARLIGERQVRACGA